MSPEQPPSTKPRIRRIGRAVFTVSSRSHPDVVHTVDVSRLRCDCEAGQFGRRCWHLVWAIQAEHWLARAAEQAKLTRAAEETQARLLEAYP